MLTTPIDVIIPANNTILTISIAITPTPHATILVVYKVSPYFKVPIQGFSVSSRKTGNSDAFVIEVTTAFLVGLV